MLETIVAKRRAHLTEARQLKGRERECVRIIASTMQGACTGLLTDIADMETLHVVLGLAEALNHFAARLVLRATEVHGEDGRDAAQHALEQVYDRLKEHQIKLSAVVTGMAKRATN